MIIRCLVFSLSLAVSSFAPARVDALLNPAKPVPSEKSPSSATARSATDDAGANKGVPKDSDKAKRKKRADNPDPEGTGETDTASAEKPVEPLGTSEGGEAKVDDERSDEASASGDKKPKIKPALPAKWVDAFKWRCIGPANMGGRISALAVAADDSSMWWVATASGGLLKTVNNGITFENQFDHEHTVSIGDVAVAPSDSKIVWVGTGESNPRNSVSWGDGVYKSTDGGKTWKNMGLKESFQIGRVVIHPTDPNIVYVGALGRLWGPSEQRGLYKTTDGGETWERILNIDDKTGVIDVQMKPDDPETLLAATYERQRDGFDTNAPAKKFGEGSGLYKTTDGGKTWKQLKDGLPSVKLGRIGIDYYRKNPDTVYVVLESERIAQMPESAPYAGLRGEDVEVGAKLTEITPDSPAEKAELKVGDIIVSVCGVTILNYDGLIAEIRKHSAGDPATFEVVREGKTVMVDIKFASRPKEETEETEDEPQSREAVARRQQRSPFSAGLGGQRQNVQEQQGDDGQEFGGVYKSTDGGETWSRINSLNPRPMYFSRIRVDPSDEQHLYVLGVSIYRSKDGGGEFTDDGGNGVHSDNHALWIDPNDGRHMILGTDGGVYVTYDRMEKWDHINHMAIGQFYHVGVDSRRDYRVFGGLQDNGSWGGPSITRSGNGPLNDDWFRVGGGDGFICLVDPENPDLVYYSSQNGGIGRYDIETGERDSLRPRPEKGLKYRWNWKTPFILSHHNSHIYYTASNYVMRSLDRGRSPKRISPEITRTERGAATALAESPLDSDVLYVGSDDGALWATTDGGHEWNKVVDFPTDEPTKRDDEESAGPDETGEGSGASGAKRPRGGHGSGASGEGRSGGRGAGGMLERIMRRDANGDGRLQRDEAPERMLPMFDRLDGNGDGVLDRKELKAMSGRMRGGRSRRQGPPPVSDSRTSSKDAVGLLTPLLDKEGLGEVLSQSKNPSRSPLGTGGGKTAHSHGNGNLAIAQRVMLASDRVSDLPDPETTPESAPPADRKDDDGPADDNAQQTPAKPAVNTGISEPSETANAKADESESPPADDPITGDWKVKAFIPGMSSDQARFTFSLKLSRTGKVTGSMDSMMGERELSGGRFNAETKSLTFAAVSDTGSIDVRATLSEGVMNGTADFGGGRFTFDFEATRKGDEAEEEGSKYDWQPLTELLPGPRWVSSIETSRAEAGRAYVTFDGHRSDDDAPYVFTTEDHGKTWRSLRANLPDDAGSTKVIREDVENTNILYLGTEFGAWVSIDRGTSWTKFNNNLPTVAVHEIAVHPSAGEIVAATHGRSLWVLDVTPLRQMAADAMKADAYVFTPNNAIYWRPEPNRGSGGSRRYVGENPGNGTGIFYAFNEPPMDVRLEITDLSGRRIRELDVKAESGLHRVEWDMRRDAPRGRTRRAGGRGRGRRGGRFNRGRLVESGKYLVALTVNDELLTREFRVETDPEYPDYHPWEVEARELQQEVWEAFLDELTRVADLPD